MKRLVVALLLLLALSACRGPELAINDFETEEDMLRLTWRCPYWLEQTTKFVTSGEHGLLVEMPPRQYPTLYLREVPADWRGYNMFEFDVLAPAGLAGQDLMVRIDDKGPSDNFADRFEAAVPLTGAPQHVQLPVERIGRGNGGRELDLGSIERVMFYLKQSDKRVMLYFDGVRLTR